MKSFVARLKIETRDYIIFIKYQRIGVKSNIFKIFTFPLTFKIKIQHPKLLDFGNLSVFALYLLLQFINSANKKYNKYCLQLIRV